MIVPTLLINNNIRNAVVLHISITLAVSSVYPINKSNPISGGRLVGGDTLAAALSLWCPLHGSHYSEIGFHLTSAHNASHSAKPPQPLTLPCKLEQLGLGCRKDACWCIRGDSREFLLDKEGFEKRQYFQILF